MNTGWYFAFSLERFLELYRTENLILLWTNSNEQ